MHANHEHLVIVGEFVSKVILYCHINSGLNRHALPVFRASADFPSVIKNSGFRATGILTPNEVFDFILVKPLPMTPLLPLTASLRLAFHGALGCRFLDANKITLASSAHRFSTGTSCHSSSGRVRA